jgi:hypothetical protein
MRFLSWVIAAALLVAVVVVVSLVLVGGNPILLFQSVVFGPDGNNLVKNGSFEGNPASTDDELFIGGPNIKELCDGSTTLDSWVASGKGPPVPAHTCSIGAPDAVGWVVNKCGPAQVPPCPNTSGIVAEEGDSFVDLTGRDDNRPPGRYGSVSQAVETEVGKRYEVSFFIGSSSGVTHTKDGAVFVEIEGVAIPNNPFPAPPPQERSNWSNPNDPPRFRFTAVNPSTTLKFSGTVSQGNGTDYIGLDNVSLQKVCFIVTAVLFGCP